MSILDIAMLRRIKSLAREIRIGISAALSAAKTYTDEVFAEFPNGTRYLGAVDYFADLPDDAEIGDTYTVKYTGTTGTAPSGIKYVWSNDSGTERWIEWGADLKLYARTDGSYILMRVGLAENLVDISKTGTLQPLFTARQTGGEEQITDDGTAQIKSIRGNTLVWNQLCRIPATDKSLYENGVHITDNRDGTYAVYTDEGGATATTDRVIESRASSRGGHTALMSGCPAGGGASTYYLYNDWNTSKDIGNGVTYLINSSGSYDIRIRVVSGCVIPESSPVVFRPQLFDLTEMFGAGVEPTADSFRNLFGGFYDSSNSRFLNFTGTGIKSVGFNQWDEEWEPGTYKSENGTKSSNTSRIRNKNPIRVISGETYYIKASTTVTAFYYRADGTYIRYKSISKNATFIVPEDAVFMNWTTGSSSDPVTTYNHDICINLSHSGYRNGDYESYWSVTRNIPVSQYFLTGMKSVGSVYDELTPDKAVTRIGSRAYAEGDKDDPTVLTDGTTTLYPLDTPVETPISPPLNLSYRVENGGTETLLPENGSVPATAPISAVIAYGIDYVGQVNQLRQNLGSGANAAEAAEAIQSAKGKPDGDYTLKASVVNGAVSYSWESVEVPVEGGDIA